MRESSGWTTSSKRPDSSCSSSVTSAWNLRPFLSSSTMSPAPMLFDVVRAGISINRSCSIVPGNLDGGPDGVPYGAVQGDVLRAVGPHVDERRRAAGERAVERRAEGLGRRHAL